MPGWLLAFYTAHNNSLTDTAHLHSVMLPRCVSDGAQLKKLTLCPHTAVFLRTVPTLRTSAHMGHTLASLKHPTFGHLVARAEWAWRPLYPLIDTRHLLSFSAAGYIQNRHNNRYSTPTLVAQAVPRAWLHGDT